MARRRRFGSVRRLPSGRYQARYRDETGQGRAAPETFSTKADADRFLAAVQTDIARGAWRDPRKGLVTFGEWAGRYMATTIDLKPKTQVAYESLLRCWILPTFERTELTAIRPIRVKEWVAAMHAAGLSASRIRQSYHLFGAIMRAAVEDGAVPATPCVGIRLPRLPRQEPRALTSPQLAALARAMPEPYDLLVEVLGYGGLRFGEAAALRRGSVDVLHGRLLVTESLAEVNGTLHFGPPKSHQSRAITLPGTIMARLVAHLDAHVGHDPAALVFTIASDRPLRYSGFMARVWRPVARAAGLTGVTPHWLRHTCASLLIDAGASIKDVQEHLGHADASTTLNIYASVIPSRAADLAARLDQIATQAGASSVGHRGVVGKLG